MPKINEWLSSYNKGSTSKTYRSALYHFLDYINGSPVRAGYATNEDKARYEEIAVEHLKGEDFAKDLEGFLRSLKDKPPKTTTLYIAAIREWFIFNRVNLDAYDIRRIRKQIPKGEAITFEAEVDHEKIRLILAHADSSWIRAIILMLVSSGMRINELLTLTTDSIEKKGECWRVNILGKNTKTQKKRYTFISREAVAALEAWERDRVNYIKQARGINGIDKNNDDRIFPMTDDNVRVAFNNILRKAGIFKKDEETKRSDITPHAFRKFFLSQSKLGMPSDFAEFLAGHSNPIANTYSRYTVKQSCELYNKGERFVTIQAPQALIQIETDFKGQLQGYSKILENLMKENVELKNRLEKLEEIEATRKAIEAQTEFKKLTLADPKPQN